MPSRVGAKRSAQSLAVRRSAAATRRPQPSFVRRRATAEAMFRRGVNAALMTTGELRLLYPHVCFVVCFGRPVVCLTPSHTEKFSQTHERDAMAPKKAIAKKTTKRKAVAEVPAPAKKAATAAGGKLEVVIEACKS